MSGAATLLKNVFGFDGFRPGQEEIVEAVTQGENVLAIMPTGGGKSLCFQLPALMREGVIVRPLAGFGMPEHARISVGLPEENERFVKTLRVLREADGR